MKIGQFSGNAGRDETLTGTGHAVPGQLVLAATGTPVAADRVDAQLGTLVALRAGLHALVDV